MKINRNLAQPKQLGTLRSGDCFESSASREVYLVTDRYDDISHTRECVDVESGIVCDFSIEMSVLVVKDPVLNIVSPVIQDAYDDHVEFLC